MKPFYLFIWIALCFALCGYVLLAMGEKAGYYGVCGILGTMWSLFALVVAFKDAGWFGKGFISDE